MRKISGIKLLDKPKLNKELKRQQVKVQWGPSV